MSSYDIIIVGAGMFGSSAAKHIRKLEPHLRVALIGPCDNESDLARGQHFDEARICRRVEPMLPWCYLNDTGLLTYRETEKESGVDFYTPCGCIWVGTQSDKENVCGCLQNLTQIKGGADKTAYTVFDHTTTAAAAVTEDISDKGSVITIEGSADAAEKHFGGQIRLAHLEAPHDSAVGKTYYCVETGPAGGGTVHPTRYVQAQLKIAAAIEPRESCERVDDVVTEVTPPSSDADMYAVRTASGNVYRGRKVLIATAHFAIYHGLVPAAVSSRMKPLLRYAILLRVVAPNDEQAQHEANVAASAQLPSIIHTAAELEDQFYCLPPRYYAAKQGWYVKIAKCGPPPPEVAKADVSTLDGALSWYDEGKQVGPADIAPFAKILSDIYVTWPLASRVAPETDAAGREHMFLNRCIIDSTDTKTLFIDCVDGNGWFCCVGGNGKGAKTCDAIGQVAAYRVMGKAMPSEMTRFKDLYRL